MYNLVPRFQWLCANDPTLTLLLPLLIATGTRLNQQVEQHPCQYPIFPHCELIGALHLNRSIEESETTIVRFNSILIDQRKVLETWYLVGQLFNQLFSISDKFGSEYGDSNEVPWQQTLFIFAYYTPLQFTETPN